MENFLNSKTKTIDVEKWLASKNTYLWIGDNKKSSIHCCTCSLLIANKDNKHLVIHFPNAMKQKFFFPRPNEVLIENNRVAN